MPAFAAARCSLRRQPWQLVVATVFLCLSRIASTARFAQTTSFISSLDTIKGSQECAPYEVHLAISDDFRDIRASWRTAGLRCPSTVSYGQSDPTGKRLLDKPFLRSEGSSYTISEQLMCDAPARKKRFTVVMHTAVLTNLEPDASYWYSLGDSDQTWTFRAPPAPGADRPFSFIAFGDMGESVRKARKNRMAEKTVRAIADEVDSRPVGLIVHVGDLSYADGNYKVWDSFMTQIEPLSSRIPYMVGIGNHEAGPCSSGTDNDPSGERPYEPDWGNYGTENGGECGAMTAHRFVMPGGGGVEARGLGVPASLRAAQRRALVAVGTAGAAAEGMMAVEEEEEEGSGTALDGLEQHAAEQQQQEQQHYQQQEQQEQQDQQAASSNGGAADSVAAAAAGAERRERVSDSEPDNPPFWYSFEYGTVHFTMLSSEHNLEAGSKQQQWLEADLAAVDRCRTPWVIVGIHRPLYVVYPHKDNRVVGDHLRASLEDLLLDQRVDLVLSGHVHCYYRSCAAAGGRCTRDERDGIVHLVIGSAGHELSAVEDDQKDWCAEVVNEWGFGRFDVDGDELSFSFIRSDNGRVADSVRLRAKVPPGRACRH